MIKKIFELIKVYRFSLLIILVYEFLYMFRGYKGNILAIRNNKFRTDNIPCPYFFLEIISNFLKKKNIKSLIDLGCGSGRVLYFFNQKHNIKLFGIEYYQESYKLCNNMFEHKYTTIGRDLFSSGYGIAPAIGNSYSRSLATKCYRQGAARLFPF